MSAFESIRNLIQDFSKTNPLGLKLLEVQLQQEWEQLVGSTIAKHSYPESIRFTKLYLVADNSIWLQQLLFLKQAILHAIHSLLPGLALTDIILRIGSIPRSSQPLNPSSSALQTGPLEPSPFASGLVQHLNNSDLQTLLAQTITKALTGPPSSSTEPAKLSEREGLIPPMSLERPTAS